MILLVILIDLGNITNNVNDRSISVLVESSNIDHTKIKNIQLPKSWGNTIEEVDVAVYCFSTFLFLISYDT